MVTTLSSLCRAKPSSARKPTPQSGPGCQVCLIPPSINICVCLLVGGWKGEVDTERPGGHPCLKSFFSKWNVKGRHACMSMVWCYLCLFVGFSQGHGLRVLSLERKGQMLVRSCLGDDIADRFYQRDSRSFKKNTLSQRPMADGMLWCDGERQNESLFESLLHSGAPLSDWNNLTLKNGRVHPSIHPSLSIQSCRLCNLSH